MALKPYQRIGKSMTDQDRASQGAGQISAGKSGLGYIPRRGIDWGTSAQLQSLDSVARLAKFQPLELLSLLPDIIPEVGLAAWNGLRLGCGPGAVTIKAMTVGPGGGSEEDAEGTAAIAYLFDNNDPEVGTFEDALGQNFMSVLFSGMCATEAVPGKRHTGLKAVFPVNPLTLRFKREIGGALNLYQRQVSSLAGIGEYAGGIGGFYELMPMERFFWSRMDGFPDDPYGRAPFAPALNEVLRLLAFINDLLLAFHRVGMPRYDVGFDFEAASQAARDIMQMTDANDISRWVQQQFEEAIQFGNDLGPDEWFWHDKNSEAKVLGSGKEMPDVDKIFDILRYRLIIALKQNPVLMGFVNGSTETWSDVQWEIYGKGTQAIVQKAAAPLVKSANLHLRLMGMPLKAVAEYQPIRSIQRLEDAQAEQVEIANEIEKVAQNWQLNNTASSTITGSAPPSEADRAKDTPTKEAPMRGQYPVIAPPPTPDPKVQRQN